MARQSRDVLAKEANFARARQEAHDRLQQCRLAHSISAQHSHNLGTANAEIDALENRAPTISGIELLQAKDIIHAWVSRRNRVALPFHLRGHPQASLRKILSQDEE